MRTAAAHELARQTSDRVSMLKVDHLRLVRQINGSYASMCEFNDWVQNKSDEDWIEITGLHGSTSIVLYALLVFFSALTGILPV